MNVKSKIEKEIVVTLSESEASWLMGYMQNPIPDISRCNDYCNTVIDASNFESYEDIDTRENRSNLFESLQEQLNELYVDGVV